jgi:hypothetical protein
MIERFAQLVGSGYAWASAQPLFIQIPIGLALFLAGLYLVGWILGIAFLTVLNLRDRNRGGGSSG